MRRVLITLAATMAVLAVATPAAARPVPRAAMSQWAASIDHSSQYGSEGWSGMQAAGAPDVSGCGDNSAAWAPEKPTGTAFIDAFYDTPVKPSAVWIYQTYHPGAVTNVTVWDAEIVKKKVIYTAKPKAESKCPAILKISVKGVSFKVGVVRVTINQSKSGGSWSEIDAVKLVGTP